MIKVILEIIQALMAENTIYFYLFLILIPRNRTPGYLIAEQPAATHRLYYQSVEFYHNLPDQNSIFHRKRVVYPDKALQVLLFSLY